MAKKKTEKEPEVAPEEKEPEETATEEKPEEGPGLIVGTTKKKDSKAIGYMLECSSPRSVFVSRQRLELECQGLFCVACRTSLVFKGGKVFGSDGKTNSHHKLTAIKES